MAVDEVDQNEEEQEAGNTERKRLSHSTSGQLMTGPKGFHPDTDFDLSEWKKYTRLYRIGIITLADVCVLCWCRIYLSVAVIDSSTALVHYNFENLYDGEIPLPVDARLLSMQFSEIERFWLVEDVTSGTKYQYRRLDIKGEPLELTGVSGGTGKGVPVLYVGPSEILTVTRKASRDEDGSWPLSNFGQCLPGHTYNLQLIYGGLPSNVFTWTAPE